MLIAILNTKGGVGKSTLAVHLAVWLRDQGASVALLDGDKQASSSQWVSEAEPSIFAAAALTATSAAEQARVLLQQCDFVVADGPAGLDEVGRCWLLLADLVLFPITPSILDLRSLALAQETLSEARKVNQGKPIARLVLNRLRPREIISRQLMEGAGQFEIPIVKSVLRDLRAYRDAAQQGTVVSRLGRRATEAANEIDALGNELLQESIWELQTARSKLKSRTG